MKLFTFALPLLCLATSALSNPVHSSNSVEDFLVVVEDLAKLNAHTNFARDILRFMVYDKENAKTEFNRFLDEFPKMERLIKDCHDTARNEKNILAGPRAGQIVYKMSDWTHSTFGMLFTMQEQAEFVKENLGDDLTQKIEPALSSYKQEFDNMMERYTDLMQKEDGESGRWVKRHRQRLDEEIKRTIKNYEEGEEGYKKSGRKFGLNSYSEWW